MNIYIYNFEQFKTRPGGFEEATAAEDRFWEEIYRNHNIVDSLEQAQIALIKINNASLHYAGSKLSAIWQDYIVSVIKSNTIPHATLFSYVLYDVDLDFIPSWVQILAYESEVTVLNSLGTKNMGTYNRMCVIPYILDSQSNPAAGLVSRSLKKQDAFCFELWRQRKQTAFVGSSSEPNRPLISQRQELVATWNELFGCSVYTDRKSEEPNSIYPQYRFALVLRGDTPTRKAFYQALNAGCFPIVTESAWQQYSELFKGNIGDLRSFVVVVPDKQNQWDKEKISQQIEQIESNAGSLLTKMQQWTEQYLHYDASMIDLVLSVLSKPAIKNNKLMYVYSLDQQYQPSWIQVSEEEVITAESHNKSQYCLEYKLKDLADTYPYKTDSLEKADLAIVPFFTFLSSWKTPKFYSVQDCVASIEKLLRDNPSWKTSSVPHYIAYGDVLWDDDRVFLGKVKMPDNTTVVCLEASTHTAKQLSAPYPCEFFPANNVERKLAVYIGRRREAMEQYPISICEIDTAGWHSTNLRNEQIHDLYNSHKFSFQPHGDRATRRGFYQSIMAKCIPVITRDCVKPYSDAVSCDVAEFCVVIDGWDLSVLDKISNIDYESLAAKLPEINLTSSLKNILGITA